MKVSNTLCSTYTYTLSGLHNTITAARLQDQSACYKLDHAAVYDSNYHNSPKGQITISVLKSLITLENCLPHRNTQKGRKN